MNCAEICIFWWRHISLWGKSARFLEIRGEKVTSNLGKKSYHWKHLSIQRISLVYTYKLYQITPNKLYVGTGQKYYPLPGTVTSYIRCHFHKLFVLLFSISVTVTLPTIQQQIKIKKQFQLWKLCRVLKYMILKLIIFYNKLGKNSFSNANIGVKVCWHTLPKK